MLNKKALAASLSAPPALYVEDVFSTYLYTGTGSTQTITNGIDLAGKGGLVWTKKRSGGTANNHLLIDTARGQDKGLATNKTNAQDSGWYPTYFTGFTSTGYGVGGSLGENNETNSTYASWTFRKQPKFFDVVTWTGNNTAERAIPHNLGSVPGCIIVKAYTGSFANLIPWIVYHRSLPKTGGYPDRLELNSTGASTPSTTVWGSTAFTSTNFYIGLDDVINNSNKTYVAYLFAHDAGGFGDSGSDNVISCGSFTGDGSGNATVTLGYEPQWVLFKSSTDGTNNWSIRDVMRGMNVSTDGRTLRPNTSEAEADSTLGIKPTATGFTANGASTSTYIYIAIRRGPMKTPEAGTEVFTPVAYTGTRQANATMPSGIVDDSVWTRFRTLAAPFNALDRIRGKGGALLTNSGDAEIAQERFDWATMDGVINLSDQTGGTSYSLIDYHFKRAPKFYDIVCYTGNSSSFTVPQSVTHNLGVVPELIIIKGRTTTDAAWLVGYNFTPSQFDNGYLHSTNASNPIGYNIAFFGAAPTSTTFSVTNQIVSNPFVNNSNWSGNNYVAYLFATCPGVSKVGSYTGTGTTQQINCGFTGGARFVLIKRTDSTGDWYVWDSARGIVAGNDPYLLTNSSAVEVTNTDYVDTYAQGFEISSTAPAAINANGGTFIFLAIA